MAGVVNRLGWGGQRFAERELGWDRKTIRKGQRELEEGQVAIDGRCRSGRKRAEAHLPNLLTDIDSIVLPMSQADPTFKSTRIYTPITAKEVRTRLSERKGIPVSR